MTVNNTKRIIGFSILAVFLTISATICPAAGAGKKADPLFGGGSFGKSTTIVDFIQGLKLNESQKERFELVRKQYEKVMAEYDKRVQPARDKLDAAMLKAITPVQRNAIKADIARMDDQRESKEWMYFARMLAILTKDQKIAWHSVSMKQELVTMFQNVELGINAEQEGKMDVVIMAYLKNTRTTRLGMNLAGDPAVMSSVARAYISAISNTLSQEQRDKLFGKPLESNNVRRSRNRRWDRNRNRNNNGNKDPRSPTFKKAIKNMPNVPKSPAAK